MYLCNLETKQPNQPLNRHLLAQTSDHRSFASSLVCYPVMAPSSTSVKPEGRPNYQIDLGLPCHLGESGESSNRVLLRFCGGTSSPSRVEMLAPRGFSAGRLVGVLVSTGAVPNKLLVVDTGVFLAEVEIEAGAKPKRPVVGVT